MNKLEKISIGLDLLFRRFSKGQRPILVSYTLTRKCNQNCSYCGWPSQAGPELNEAEAGAFIRDLAKGGVRMMALTGGEPLLRQDLGALIQIAKDNNLYVGVNTNGKLVPERLDALLKADYVQVSLDGPRQVHDPLRGEGTFDAAVAAVEILRSRGMKVKINTTVTRHLIGNLEPLLEIGRRTGASIMFHPVSHVHAYDEPLDDVRMYEKQLFMFFGELIAAKKKGAPVINSPVGLDRLRGVPKRMPPKCFAGKIFIAADPEGRISLCNQRNTPEQSFDATGGNYRRALESLPPCTCRQCWCAGPMEMSLILSFDKRAIASALRAWLFYL